MKFDLLKLNFESNYNFYWKKDRLILIDNFIDSGSIINIKLFFSSENIEIDNWKDNYSILKLDENEIEEPPKIKYSYETKSFDIILPKNDLYHKKMLHGLFTFYISDYLKIPIEIKSKIKNIDVIFVSYNPINDNYDSDNFHIFIYKNLRCHDIYFTILFENDKEEHNIYLHDIRQSDYDYSNEINFKIYQNNYRKIKGNITFKITAYFNQYWLTSRIKNKKYFFKISIDNDMIEKELISKIFFEEIYETYWYSFYNKEENINKQLLTIPYIGFNYKSNRYENFTKTSKLEEFKSRNGDYIFYNPFFCNIINQPYITVEYNQKHEIEISHKIKKISLL